jgi:hypothetical protein
MAHRRNHDLKLRPPKFTGKKGEQIKQFFSRFEKYIQHHEVAQVERVTCLGLMLENDALEYYDNLIDENNDQEYEDIKDCLILRFDDERIRLVIRSKLHSRKLKVGESITEYYSEMQKEGAKITLSDEDFLFIFLNGLPKNIKQHVALQNPENTMAAFRIAKNFEQIRMLEDDSTDSKKLVETLRLELGKGNTATTASASADKNELKELKETLHQLQETIKNMELEKQTGPPSHGQYSQSPWYKDGVTPYQHNDDWQHCSNRPPAPGYNHWNNYPMPAFRNNVGYNTNPVGQSNYTTRRGNSNNRFNNTFNQGPTNAPGRRNYWQTPPNNMTHNRPPQQHNQYTTFPQRTTNNALDISGNVTDNKCNQTARSNIVAANRESVSTGTTRDMSLTGTIAQLEVTILLDTGSEISIISKDCLDKLQPTHKVCPSHYDSILAVNGSESALEGQITETITINDYRGDINLHILKESQHDIILGRDFMSKNIAAINIQEGVVIFTDSTGKRPKSAKLNSNNTQTRTHVTVTPAKVVKKVTLTPNSTTNIALYPKDNILATNLHFQGKSDFLDTLGLHMDPAVVSGLTGIMHCKITNKTGRPVTLYPDKHVGSFTITRARNVYTLREPTPTPHSEINSARVNSSHLIQNVDTLRPNKHTDGSNNQYLIIHPTSQIVTDRKNHRIKVLSEITEYFRRDTANKAGQ